MEGEGTQEGESQEEQAGAVQGPKAGKKSSVTTYVALGVCAIIILIALGVGFGFMRFDLGEPTPDTGGGGVTCTDWVSAPKGYQKIFEDAAKKAHIQPALLGAIFRQEHGNAWATAPWATSPSGAAGPFQFMPDTWNGYKSSCGTGNVQDLGDASCGAAKFLASKLTDQIKTSSMTTSEQDIKDVAVAYTSSPKYFTKWVSGGRKDSDLNPDYVTYHTNVWKYFQELNIGCHDSINSQYSGKKFNGLDQIKQLFGSTKQQSERNLTSVNFMGRTIRVNKILVEPLKKVEQQIKASGTSYKVHVDSSYVWKTNFNNSSVLSGHSFGLAIDINVKANPNTKRPSDCKAKEGRDESCCPHDIPPEVSSAFEKNDFFWGAHFRYVCDAMHFQYGGNNY